MATVFPIHKSNFLTYASATILVFGTQVIGSPSMGSGHTLRGSGRSRAIGDGAEQSLPAQHGADGDVNQSAFAAYSYGSPEFRQSLKHLAANQSSASGQETQIATDKPATSTPPTATTTQMDNQPRTIDPCTKLEVDAIPPPADRPHALDSVKDRDPELYRQIQAKVTDPRYTGELGNVTVSTHDKKGRVTGCTFIQNVPYWESGPAAQALVDVNLELAKKGKRLLEADPLNGAGRTLGQEEGIVWRNSGLHAKVGKSNHGFGRAIDFKEDPDADPKKQLWDDPVVNSTLHAHGWRQGDTWGPLKNDLHHWSFVGPGPAEDGPPPQKRKHGHRP